MTSCCVTSDVAVVDAPNEAPPSIQRSNAFDFGCGQPAFPIGRHLLLMNFFVEKTLRRLARHNDRSRFPPFANPLDCVQSQLGLLHCLAVTSTAFCLEERPDHLVKAWRVRCGGGRLRRAVIGHRCALANRAKRQRG